MGILLSDLGTSLTQAQYLIQSLTQAWDELCLADHGEQSLLAVLSLEMADWEV